MAGQPDVYVEAVNPYICGGPGIMMPIPSTGTFDVPKPETGCQCCRGEISRLESRLNSELESLRREIAGLRGYGSDTAAGDVWIGLVKKRDIDELAPSARQSLDDALRTFLIRWKGKAGYPQDWASTTALETEARKLLADAGVPVRNTLTEWYGAAGAGDKGQGKANETVRDQVDSLTAQAAFSLYFFGSETQHKWSTAGFILWTMALLCEYRLISRCG